MNEFRRLIDEMKLMVNDNPSIKLTDFINETFVLPESFDNNMDYEVEEPSSTSMLQQQPSPQQNNVDKKGQVPVENKISGIEKELTDIRKISLNVIARLADQPSSEQYQLMKKIWNTVDKAIENGSSGTNSEA